MRTVRRAQRLEPAAFTQFYGSLAHKLSPRPKTPFEGQMTRLFPISLSPALTLGPCQQRSFTSFSIHRTAPLCSKGHQARRDGEYLGGERE